MQNERKMHANERKVKEMKGKRKEMKTIRDTKGCAAEASETNKTTPQSIRFWLHVGS